MIRVIAGCWRGRRVPVPDLPGLRPTPSRVRETLFNWLREELPGSRCLDLFAGSGILGIEALSRGAREVVAVDRDPGATRMLRETAASWPVRGIRVVTADAGRFLETDDGGYDVIFLDPPFGQGLVASLIQQIADGPALRAGGVVYAESESSVEAADLPSGWSLWRARRAGDVAYHLLRSA